VITLTPEAILETISSASVPLNKRDIAKALNVKGGNERIALKRILKELNNDGVIAKFAGGTFGIPKGLPPVTILIVTEITIDGEMMARPAEWNTELQGEAPRIEIMPEHKGFAALAEGHRVLARLSRQNDAQGDIDYTAKVIRNLQDEAKSGGGKGTVLGLVRISKSGARLIPAEKKARYEYDIEQKDLNGANDGDLALGEIQPSRGMRDKIVRIVKVIGRRDDPKAISLISAHENGLRDEFPQAAMDEAQGLEVPPIQAKGDKGYKREDLRAVPLVTIDGADARDFDDAVFAEKLDDGGYHMIVAIADVSHYVRYGSAIDNEALRRGNSTYFPDRVIPMLPEALSNDLCSLRPDEDRAALAVHMHIDEDGNLETYKFTRALIRSHARLIYDQVQAAMDGNEDAKTAPLMDSVIRPLYAAFDILNAARQKRGALDLDMPEKQILVDDTGTMTGITKRARLTANMVIEEFMVLANVAAAKALEAKKAPCVYRIHDTPKSEKLDSARNFISSFGLTLPKGQNIKPGQLNAILRKAKELPYSHLISTVILRSQSQAVYSPQNIGHYGLALTHYGHFTSPIRRYADLLVHRSLVRAYGLGQGGLEQAEEARLAEICEDISTTERASMSAERSSVDRFTASYLQDKIGAEFAGRISGVSRFGLFVELEESGTDGLIPLAGIKRTCRDDYYIHDEEQHCLVGRRHRVTFRLGAAVTVKLKEADGFTGSCVLELAGESTKGAEIAGFVSQKRSHGSQRSRDYKARDDDNRTRKPHGKKPGHAPNNEGSAFNKKKSKKKTTPKHKRKKK
jgi:ribonuclease R